MKWNRKDGKQDRSAIPTDRYTNSTSGLMNSFLTIKTIQVTGKWAQSEYKHSLTFCIRHYIVIATKPMHRLQIHPSVHNQRAPSTIPSYIQIRAVLWECGEGQTDRYTHGYTDGHDHYTLCIFYDSHEM